MLNRDIAARGQAHNVGAVYACAHFWLSYLQCVGETPAYLEESVIYSFAVGAVGYWSPHKQPVSQIHPALSLPQRFGWDESVRLTHAVSWTVRRSYLVLH